MNEFLLFAGLIYGSLLLGWMLRRVLPSLERHSRRIARITMIGIQAPVIVLVFWSVDSVLLSRYYPVVLASLVVLAVSGLVGLGVTRVTGGDRARSGAFVLASMFSNVGSSFGGFICLLFLGDSGLVISQLFLIVTIPAYFTAGFAIARRFSVASRPAVRRSTVGNLSSLMTGLPLLAIFAGLVLGLSGIELPDSLAVPRQVLVYAAAVLLSLSFGLTAHLRPMLRRLREYAPILPVKFIAGPIAGLTAAALFVRIFGIDQLAFKVIVIQSAMPVAVWAVAAAKLFTLDEELALGLWISSTLFVAALVPAIAWFARI